MLIIVTGALLAITAGVALKFALSRTAATNVSAITTTELILGSLICSCLLIPLVSVVGLSIARAEQAQFREYWSGLEKTADRKVITCTRDGSCRHTYQCDPYQVTETYTVQVPYTTTESYTTADGKSSTRTVTKYRTEYRTRQVTRYHRCPHVDAEYTYTVTDTLGDSHRMGEHWFPANPEKHRWRAGHRSLPSVPTGEPKLWAAARDRIKSGTPGGVTSVHTYKNYLLASSEDIYAKSSGAIKTYRKAGLLPPPAKGVYDHYRADKVYFAGPALTNAKAWQEAVQRFNGTFGSTRQGDLHVVIATSPKITNADEYTNAVNAYWQSEDLGKDALSKNAYVVVLGAPNGTSVEWARGFSGMPVGNESLAVKIREQLVGAPLTPEALIGTSSSKSTDGGIGSLLLAPANEGGFKRVAMKDFEYLYAQIDASPGQKVVIILVGFLLALLLWGAFIAVDLRLPSGVATWFDALAAQVARRGRGGASSATTDTSSGRRWTPYRTTDRTTETSRQD